jgi:hypothetical protein
MISDGIYKGEKVALPPLEDNVKPLPYKNVALSALRGEIKKLVYSYSERISLAEAIGILEIVKVELIDEHQ